MIIDKNTNFEEIFKRDLHQYLCSIDRVDEHLPEAPDLEELWAKIGESYLPDAMKEFTKYPTVSLGWIMFVGLAMAKYWDVDWELYSKVENHYEYLKIVLILITWMITSVRKYFFWMRNLIRK